MMLIDTHCHLNCLELSACGGSLDAALSLAQEADVGRFICIGLNLADASEVLEIAKQYQQVYATVGIHPTEVCQPEPSEEDLYILAQGPKVVAIGECGLDYYRETVAVDVQKARFRMQLSVAKQLDKPVVVHMRDTAEDTLALIKESGLRQGVLHCFTGTYAQAMAAIELGFMISFSGIITFKNAQDLREVAAALPLDKVLVETDSPYLAPHPYRGKPNHPAYVRLVAEQLAQLHDMEWMEIARITTNNAEKLFQLPVVESG